MAGNFLKYAGPLTTGDLPVDAHELIAICAPRPVFISGGAAKATAGSMPRACSWPPPPPARSTGCSARRAWARHFPPIETALMDGDLAFRSTPADTRRGRIGHSSSLSPAAICTRPALPHQHRRWVETALPLPSLPSRIANACSLFSASRTPTCAIVPPAMSTPPTQPTSRRRRQMFTQHSRSLVAQERQARHNRGPMVVRAASEIVADYEREVLGKAPANLPKVTWKIVKTTAEKYGGFDVVTKILTGHVDNSLDPQISVHIQMVLITPAHAKEAGSRHHGTGLRQGFPGRSCGIAPAGIGSGPLRGRRPAASSSAAGLEFAVLSPTSFQADDGSGLTAGIIGLMNKGQPRGLDDWGTLRAWAWGASRADGLSRIRPSSRRRSGSGLEGHSRFGKTALVDHGLRSNDSPSLYSSSSGEGGAKLYRHIFGEQMSQKLSPGLRSYHWFDGNFLRYERTASLPGDLPVDNHELIALCAPRPVFIGSRRQHRRWVRQPQRRRLGRRKGDVSRRSGYVVALRLLRYQALAQPRFQPIETALNGSGDLGFRQHPFGHTPVPNWPGVPGIRGRTFSSLLPTERTRPLAFEDPSTSRCNGTQSPSFSGRKMRMNGSVPVST